jgi:hypothetical protein
MATFISGSRFLCPVILGPFTQKIDLVLFYIDTFIRQTGKQKITKGKKAHIQ